MNEEMLLHHLEQAYHISITSISHIREMIGSVFRVNTDPQTLCFKAYPASWKAVCDKSARVQDHVAKTCGIAPLVYPATTDDLVIDLVIDDVSYAGFLMDFIDGESVDRTKGRAEILSLANTLHGALATYPLPLDERDANYYISLFDEFASIERFDPRYVQQVKIILNDMYHLVRHLPRGVVHGDFHTGNVIRRHDGRLMIIDFDSVGHGHPYNDLATCFDASHFNRFHPVDFQHTKSSFQTMVEDAFVPGMMAFLPLRHMEIIAAIGLRHGTNSFHNQLMDQQLSWIQSWHELVRQLVTHIT